MSAATVRGPQDTSPVLTPMAAGEQSAFRVLLDCMARPGKVGGLGPVQPADGGWSAALQAMQVVLDHEVTFAVAAESPAVRETLLRRTGSRTAPLDRADYAVADADHALKAVNGADEGDLDYPERGATVVIRCARLGKGPVRLRLAGPGINGHAHLAVDGLASDVFRAIADRNASFPLGIDVVLAAEDGDVACLPRTTRISLEEDGE